ncbi:hypothetical protein, conserved [Eimeria brunetti]|uniref:Immune mapped protein 2 N-terminal domain-containing protein n=1 Tax=Eimeria brunetti TaxID=51314 RepID=U6LBN3_9EIME|nr:hypothetical protein, conserved [Eimeria brunetti]
MFSCCCGDTATRGDLQTEEKPEDLEGQQAAAAAAAAPAAAAAAPAAAAGEPAATETPAADAAATPAAAAANHGAAAAAEKETAATAAAGKKFNITAAKEEAPVKKPMTAPTVDRARRTSVPMECALGEGVFLMYDKATDTIYAQWSVNPQPSALAWLKPLVAIPNHKFKVHGGRQTLFTKAVESGKYYQGWIERLGRVESTIRGEWKVLSGVSITPRESGKYYQGWIKFITIANEYPSKLMLLENFEASGAPDVLLLQLVSPAAAAAAAAAGAAAAGAGGTTQPTAAAAAAGAAAGAAAAAAAAGGGESICIATPFDLFNKLYDLKNIFAVAAVSSSSKLIPLQQQISPQKFLQMGRGEGDAAPIQIKRT